MLDRVPQRVGLRTGRFFLPATQSTAQDVQPLPQAGQQVIPRLQRPRQTQRVGRRPDTGLREQRGQQRPQAGGCKRMPGQHRSQKHRKRVPAPAALAAIRTEDPLATEGLAGGTRGIVAVEPTVPIQRLGAAAAGAALLLERKSACCSAGSSRTKRNGVAVMVLLSARSAPARRGFSDGTSRGGTRSRRTLAKRGTALTALRPRCHRKNAQPCGLTSARERHFLRRHCGPQHRRCRQRDRAYGLARRHRGPLSL
jgi:hypothetical protein